MTLWGGMLTGSVNPPYRCATSLGQLAHVAIGPRAGKLVDVMAYIVLMLRLGSFIILLTNSWQAMDYKNEYCGPIAGLIACALLLLPNQLRSMDQLAITSAVAFVTIVITIAICVNSIVTDERDFPIVVEAVNSNSTVFEFFSALGDFSFALAGQSIFVQIMSEMKRPEDFSKALIYANVLCVTMFLLTMVTFYGYLGSKSGVDVLLDVIPDGATKVVAAASLFIHMVLSYIISSQVLTRAVLDRFVQSALKEPNTLQARLWWLGTSTIIMAVAFTFANLIPIYTELVGLIGNLMFAPLSYMLPCIMFLYEMRRRLQLNDRLQELSASKGKAAFVVDVDKAKSVNKGAEYGESTVGVDSEVVVQDAPSAAGAGAGFGWANKDTLAKLSDNIGAGDVLDQDVDDTGIHFRSSLKPWKPPFGISVATLRGMLYTVIGIGVFLLIMGTVSSLETIIASSGSGGRPFNC